MSETEVADGAGAANRRFAVAVDDWNAATGRGRRNPEQDRRSRVGTPEKRTGLWDRIAAQRLPVAAEDTESDTTVIPLPSTMNLNVRISQRDQEFQEERAQIVPFRVVLKF